MLGQPVQSRTQVLDVIEQDAFLIKDTVQDIEHAGLSLVQTQDAGHQIGSHLTQAGSHADALLTKNVIKPYRTALKGKVFLVHAELGQPLLDKARQFARLTHARQVALHVGHETGHACLAETLGNHLQRHRFTRSRGAGNQSMPVGHVAQDADGSVGTMGDVESVFLSVHDVV